MRELRRVNMTNKSLKQMKKKSRYFFQVFDGYSEESGLVLAMNWSRVVPPINGTVTGHSFQVVVVLRAATGSDVSLNATFHAVRKCLRQYFMPF